MTPQTIPAHSFDLSRFVETIVSFWGDQEVAFPLVENGFADFGTACLGDDADRAGDHPLDWLRHGHTLFGQYTRRDVGRYDLADGGSIDPDQGDPEETQLDESTTHGFLVSVKDGLVTIETAILSDVTGECRVYPVENAGVFENRMRRFVGSMTAPA